MTIDDLEGEVEGVAEEDLEEAEEEEEDEGVLEEETREDLRCMKQPVLIAVKDVKSPLSQEGISLFIAVTALKEMMMEEVDPIDLAIGGVGVAAGILEDPILKTGKCIRQLVLNAATDVKFLSSPQVINLFTVTIALVQVKAEEGISGQKNLTNLQSSMSS